MLPQRIGYTTIALYDALNRMIGVKVIYGTRYFVWAVNEQQELTELVLVY